MKKPYQSDDQKPSFWKTLPGVLTAIASLIAAIAGLLATFQHFNSGSEDSKSSNNPPSVMNDPSSNNTPICQISGVVYNYDKLPAAVGLGDIKIAYITASKPNLPIHMKTTGPDGSFSFNCPLIDSSDFPLHLQMTYSWNGQNQIVQWDDPIYAGNNTEPLYLSLHDITNWHRINVSLMHVNRAALLKKNNVLSLEKPVVLQKSEPQ